MNELRPVVAFLLILQVSGHDWGWGPCPAVDPQPNIGLNKFLGMWYVIEQFETGSSCYVYNYTRVSDTQLRVTKGRQYDFLVNAGLKHTNTYSGSLDIPNPTDQGRLRVKWPANIVGKSDYIIFSTDYETYAGVYDCQQVTSFGHRQSAAILSRNPTLPQMYVDKVKNTLKKSGVHVHDFDKIKQTDCIEPTKSTLNVNIDDSTLKDLFNSAVDGVKDIGTVIADTSVNLYNEGKKRLGYKKDDRSTIIVRGFPQEYFNPDAEIIN